MSATFSTGYHFWPVQSFYDVSSGQTISSVIFNSTLISLHCHDIHLDSTGGSSVEIAFSWPLEKLQRSVSSHGAGIKWRYM